MNKDIFIHLSAEKYCKPGVINLLASPQDFKELEDFFSRHFGSIAYVKDEMGFPTQAYRVPAGHKFARDENGQLLKDASTDADGQTKSS